MSIETGRAWCASSTSCRVSPRLHLVGTWNSIRR
jgi:hypothetical protein